MEVGNLFVRLGLNKDNFDSGMNGAKSQVNSFKGVLNSAMTTMIGFGAYDLGSKLVSGFKNAIKAGIDYNATLEGSRIAWTTLLGTQEKADNMLQRIEKFAATTPFEKMGVDTMAKQLNNAGLQGDALFTQLTRFGDLAGAFAIPEASLEEMVRQYAQVKQAGVAYTEDLNILQDRGIPIYKALSQVLGINTADVKKWASDGKINADIYQKALDSVAKGVEGGMTKQSQSFNGMISNLKDSLSQLTGLMAKDLFASLKGSLQNILPVIDGITNAFKNGGFMGVIQQYAPALKPYMTDLSTLIQTTITQIQTVVQSFQVFWKEHGDLIMSIIKFAWDFILNIIKSTINSISVVIQSGLSIIDGIINLFSNLAKGNFSGAWDAIKQIFSSAIDFVINLVNLIFISKIKGLFTSFKTIATDLTASAWGTIKSIFSGGLESVKTFVSGIPAAVKTFMNDAITYLKGINLFDVGKNIIQGLINGIKSIGANVAGAIGEVVSNGIAAAKRTLGINSPSKVFMQFGEYIGQGLSIGVDNSNSIVQKSMSKLNSTVLGTGTNIKSNSTDNSSRQNVIEIPVYLDGNMIAKVTQPYLDKIQGNNMRLVGRGIGV